MGYLQVELGTQQSGKVCSLGNALRMKGICLFLMDKRQSVGISDITAQVSYHTELDGEVS